MSKEIKITKARIRRLCEQALDKPSWCAIEELRAALLKYRENLPMEKQAEGFVLDGVRQFIGFSKWRLDKSAKLPLSLRRRRATDVVDADELIEAINEQLDELGYDDGIGGDCPAADLPKTIGDMIKFVANELTGYEPRIEE